MPRRKTDIFVDYINKPIIRGIKLRYDVNTDSYWGNLSEIIDKLPTHGCVLMERSYIIQNFEKYHFSNILIEKTKYDKNIKLIFEKTGNNKFVSDCNLEDTIDNLKIEDNCQGFYDDEEFLFYVIEKFDKIIRKQLKIDKIYLAGSYIIRNNHKLYLSQFTVDFDRDIQDFNVDVFLVPSKCSRLNEKIQFIKE